MHPSLQSILEHVHEPKETPFTLTVTPHSPLFQAPGNHISTIYFNGFFLF